MKLSSIFILYSCDEAMPDLLAVAATKLVRRKTICRRAPRLYNLNGCKSSLQK